jgi:hypothetical protein
MRKGQNPHTKNLTGITSERQRGAGDTTKKVQGIDRKGIPIRGKREKKIEELTLGGGVKKKRMKDDERKLG